MSRRCGPTLCRSLSERLRRGGGLGQSSPLSSWDGKGPDDIKDSMNWKLNFGTSTSRGGSKKKEISVASLNPNKYRVPTLNFDI